jgi:hypothetical protein
MVAIFSRDFGGGAIDGTIGLCYQKIGKNFVDNGNTLMLRAQF